MGAAEIHGATVPAGSAVIFCEQTTHGTMPWVAPGGRQRKTLFYKWSTPSPPAQSTANYIYKTTIALVVAMRR